MTPPTTLGLVELLRQSPELDPYRLRSPSLEQELAYDLNELLESFEKISKIVWPALKDAKTPEAAGEALFEFREELRHVLYHIENSIYFSMICGGVDGN